MSDRPSIEIVGGGIGGLTAALSMLDAGLDVHVYEQARELSEVGAGIQISPNASPRSCMRSRRSACTSPIG